MFSLVREDVLSHSHIPAVPDNVANNFGHARLSLSLSATFCTRANLHACGVFWKESVQEKLCDGSTPRALSSEFLGKHM